MLSSWYVFYYNFGSSLLCGDVSVMYKLPGINSQNVIFLESTIQTFSEPAAILNPELVLLLLTFCLLLFPLWESVIVICFVVCYFMSILVLQSSWWGRESWLICIKCLPGVSWWLSGSSSRCHGVVCSLWLWYILIILTYYFGWIQACK